MYIIGGTSCFFFFFYENNATDLITLDLINLKLVIQQTSTSIQTYAIVSFHNSVIVVFKQYYYKSN